VLAISYAGKYPQEEFTISARAKPASNWCQLFAIPEGATMKPATIIGIVLIIIGIVGFAVGGFSFTHEHQDAKIGPMQIEHQQTSTVPIPPILSTIAVVGGIGLVIVGAKSK
jgi:hypothetical protein